MRARVLTRICYVLSWLGLVLSVTGHLLAFAGSVLSEDLWLSLVMLLGCALVFTYIPALFLDVQVTELPQYRRKYSWRQRGWHNFREVAELTMPYAQAWLKTTAYPVVWISIYYAVALVVILLVYIAFMGTSHGIAVLEAMVFAPLIGLYYFSVAIFNSRIRQA
jgi:hypothetical protein